MSKNDERIAVRLPSEQREMIEQLIHKGQFKNLSHAIRTALKEFLSTIFQGSDCCASE
jgi:Arc/MetJ-type ribon-helix-helix transcriptional regulator